MRRVALAAATNSASGARYYGTRFYSPSQGRFINRDSIEEQGGLNLYAFCSNNAVNRYDVLGRDDFQILNEYGQWVSGDGLDGMGHNQSSVLSMAPDWGSWGEGKADGAAAISAWHEAKDAQAKQQAAQTVQLAQQTFQNTRIAGNGTSGSGFDGLDPTGFGGNGIGTGNGFYQLFNTSCDPTALRQLAVNVGISDPGEYRAMQLTNSATNTPSGFGVLQQDQRFMANAARQLGIPATASSFNSTFAMLNYVGNNSAIVTGRIGDSNGNGDIVHAVTMTWDPTKLSYRITNPSGAVGVGGSINVSIPQMFAPIPNVNLPSFMPNPVVNMPTTFTIVPNVSVITAQTHDNPHRP